MKYLSLFPILTICLLLGQGCTNSAPSPTDHESVTRGPAFNGSCNAREIMGFCYNYLDDDWTREDTVSDCWEDVGVVEDEVCTMEDAIATCFYTLPEPTNKNVTYVFYRDMTLEQAEMSCPEGGTFRELPQE
ncbi:hypothetical protein GF380_05255 [Candidatus Uhrbacteria bacterium]|nr:hypothetical protein [Candidatus Uhrbacteria bacterium]MBD3284439.1 hypothetical protein [Candidatus Uhrbacteria bacterium]